MSFRMLKSSGRASEGSRRRPAQRPEAMDQRRRVSCMGEPEGRSAACMASSQYLVEFDHQSQLSASPPRPRRTPASFAIYPSQTNWQRPRRIPLIGTRKLNGSSRVLDEPRLAAMVQQRQYDMQRTSSVTMIVDLWRLSNSRDSGDLQIWTGRFLHSVGRIGCVVPQDVLWVLRLGLKGTRGDEETGRRDWGRVDEICGWRKSENKPIKNI
jgi:hypothetical protein